MWPVEELRPSLPAHLQAFEDTDVLTLRCLRCGWTATFSVLCVTRQTIAAEAQWHYCPVKARTPSPGEVA